MIWLLACSPSIEDSSAPGEDRIALSLSPESIDFGDFSRGQGATEVVTVTNTGNVPLALDHPVLTGAEGFEILVDLPQELAPGAAVQLPVAFVAETVEHEAQLVVRGPDVRATVDLRGGGLMPLLAVSPDPWDAGRVDPGCWTEDTLTLANIGSDTMVLETLAPVGEGFTVDGLTLPISVPPGEAVEAVLRFSPTELEPYTGEIWVAGNVPEHAVTASGEGVVAAEVVLTWFQPTDGVMDVVFVVDSSGSMEDDRQRLALSLDAFLEPLQDADYRIGVVVDDSGCVAHDVITPQSADPHGDLSTGLFRVGGMFAEAGFVLADNFVDQTGTGQCNDTLGRPDASLHLVFVSDEPEQSPPALGGSDAMVTRILEQRPGALLHAHVASVPHGGDCGEAGLGYYDAAVATGGLVQDLCDPDWSAKMGALAETVAQPHRPSVFYLPDGDIQDDTLVVQVDGQAVQGWTYEDHGDSRWVAFDQDAVPPAGSQVTIRYANSVTCE